MDVTLLRVILNTDARDPATIRSTSKGSSIHKDVLKSSSLLTKMHWIVIFEGNMNTDGIYSSRGNCNPLYMYANINPIKYLLLQVQWSSGSRRRLYTAKIPSSNLGWIMFRGSINFFIFLLP